MAYLKYILLFVGALVPFIKDLLDSVDENETGLLSAFKNFLKKFKVGIFSFAFICSCIGIYLAFEDEQKSEKDKKDIVEKNRKDSSNIENNLAITKKALENTETNLKISNSTNEILNTSTSQIQEILKYQIDENSKLKFPIQDNFELTFTISLKVVENKLQAFEKIVLQNTKIEPLDSVYNIGIGVFNEKILNLSENYLNFLKNIGFYIEFIDKKNKRVLLLSQRILYPFANEEDWQNTPKKIQEGDNIKFHQRLVLIYYPATREFKIKANNISLKATQSAMYSSIYDINSAKTKINFFTFDHFMPKPLPKTHYYPNLPQSTVDYFNSINSEFRYKIEVFSVNTKSGLSLVFDELKKANKQEYETKTHIFGYKQEIKH